MANSLSFNVRVAKLRLEAEDIVSLDLVSADGHELPAFTAGSHVDVEVLPGLVRQYSLYNSPAERSHYSIAVLREPQSRGGSAAVHQSLIVGSLIRISEPRNHFALVASARRSLLLAGGIGVTPILSMAYELHRKSSKFEFHYCTRKRSRTAFYDDIRSAEWADCAQIHFDEGADSQKLNLDILEDGATDHHLYVCGPKGFIDFILKAATDRSWYAGNLHREYFATGGFSKAAEQGAFSVQIASTGAVFNVPSGKSVVEALSEHGIAISTICAEGICGTCITRVLSGIPDHRDMIFSDEERAANDQFTPCCSRSKTPLLVLDL